MKKNNNKMVALNDDVLSRVCGGSFWEGEIGDKYIDIYRAGVTYVNTAFTADKFYIGSKQISKEYADKLVSRSMKLWKQSYEKSGDLIGFTREWKSILASEGIEWDGRMGEYKVSVF